MNTTSSRKPDTRASWTARLAFAFPLFLSTIAGAQTPAGDPTPQPMTSAPVVGQSGVAITASVNLQSGRTDTRAWSLDGMFSHTTPQGLLLRVEAQTNVTYYRVAPGQRYTEIANNDLASVLLLKRLRNKISAIGIGGWARDALLDLDNRSWVEGGIGVNVVEKPAVNLFVSPLVAVGREHRSFTEEGDRVADIGLIQSLSLKAHEKLTIDELLAMHADTTSNRDQNIALNLSVLSTIVPHVNLKVFYQYQYSELVPRGADPTQISLGVAVQVSYARTRKAPAPAPRP